MPAVILTPLLYFSENLLGMLTSFDFSVFLSFDEPVSCEETLEEKSLATDLNSFSTGGSLGLSSPMHLLLEQG